MSNMMLKEAKEVLDILINDGYQAYFVGGYVRDRLLGREVKDIDIATSATPDDVLRLFAHTAPTGLKHGTVTVISTVHVFEVTTFRTESQYEQHRRPKEVRFVSELAEDLKRRDFTMNAMAMDRDEQLIDPYGGWNDLRQGILRAVGNPSERFEEDALRMLRCVRFAAEYGLHIEEETWQAIEQNKSLFTHIAMERVRSEWERMISGRDPERASRLLFDSGLLRHLKRPLSIPHSDWNSTNTPPTFARISLLTGMQERWAFFFLAADTKSDQVRQALRILTFAKTVASEITSVVVCHEWVVTELKPLLESGEMAINREWKRGALRFGRMSIVRWLNVVEQLIAVPDETLDLLRLNGTSWLDELPVERLNELEIDGLQIVQAIGIPAGPWIGELLNRLLEDVALGDLLNDPALLLQRAIQYRRMGDGSGDG